MNAEELKAYVESKGYTHVSVQVYRNSFRVNYWSPECKMQRRLGVSLSSLPSTFDGTRWAFWLIQNFPPVTTCVEKQSEKKENYELP